MNSKLEQLKEYARIMKDTPYALRTYLQTYDNTQKKYVPMDLFQDQIQLIEDYENYNENITRKYRQAGVTTVTAAWLSKKLQLAKPENPERVLLIANKRDTAVEMANKIRNFLDQWPDWINVGFSPDKNSESRFKLNNGCEVKAVATSADALRGYTPTILVFDEAAYIEAGEDFWSASMASLSTGGKIILISTPNGYDPIYYGVYDQAIRKINDFHITDLRWFKDPRYTKDLRWIKCTDIVHYMLNRELYNDDEVVMYDYEIEKYVEYIESGYKPFSTWFESMSKKFKYDKRKISQELECDFLGSGDGVISSDVQENIRKNMIRVPNEKYMVGTLWQWKEPIENHRYIMGVDVSSGQSDDFSSFNVIDFDDREQVLEYVGKIAPDDLASVVYKWATLYNAFIVVDITGGWGGGTSKKLKDMNYKNLYYEGVNTQNIWDYNAKAMEKLPGINFNNKRVQIVSAFEEQLRKGFIVRSSRLLNELNTFVYMNGRPDHMKGAHDDSIMSMSIAMYAGDICFNQLQRTESVNKAMMESWTMSERTYEPQKSFYSYGGSFDQISGMYTDETIMSKNAISISNMQQFNEYSWLFGKTK